MTPRDAIRLADPTAEFLFTTSKLELYYYARGGGLGGWCTGLHERWEEVYEEAQVKLADFWLPGAKSKVEEEDGRGVMGWLEWARARAGARDKTEAEERSPLDG